MTGWRAAGVLGGRVQRAPRLQLYADARRRRSAGINEAVPLRSCAWLLLVLLAMSARLVGAQGAPVDTSSWADRSAPPTTTLAARRAGHARVLAANAALGGLTAGVLRRMRGGSFRTGFVWGATGGAMAYGGKAVGAIQRSGAGLLGRQLGSVGASLTLQASTPDVAVPIRLPIGPVNLYVERDSAGRTSTRARLDLVAAAAVIRIASDGGTRWEARRSLSAGMFVFRDRAWEHPGLLGLADAGVVVLRDDPEGRLLASDVRRSRTAPHERVHVIADDYLFGVWGLPLERAALARLPWGSRLGRYVDIGVSHFLVPSVARVVPHDRRPWEEEASFLSGTW